MYEYVYRLPFVIPYPTTSPSTPYDPQCRGAMFYTRWYELSNKDFASDGFEKLTYIRRFTLHSRVTET